MKNRCMQSAVACVGAVVGAGFASGREVVSFFSRYGAHSWWLILACAAASMAFCALCMRASRVACADGWYALYEKRSPFVRLSARLCGVMLAAVVGGAMTSASGHIVALLWPSVWAYPVGALGTLAAAWRLGFGSMKPLSAVSWVLAAALVLAVLLCARLGAGAPGAVPLSPRTQGFWTLALALARAVCYAAMNISIAIGVVCGCTGRTSRACCRASALFGLMLAALLFVSNALYLGHAELADADFPIVRLLSGFGRAGFIGSAVLLYVAVFTTLAALVRSLRNAAEGRGLSPLVTGAATLLPPALLSLVGFSEIVAGLYAPVGLLCGLCILLPLARKTPAP